MILIERNQVFHFWCSSVMLNLSIWLTNSESCSPRLLKDHRLWNHAQDHSQLCVSWCWGRDNHIHKAKRPIYLVGFPREHALAGEYPHSSFNISEFCSKRYVFSNPKLFKNAIAFFFLKSSAEPKRSFLYILFSRRSLQKQNPQQT